MITRVHFENFKSLKNVTLELGRLTVLVGPNGSGKSTVLQGIDLLSQTGIPVPGEQQHTYCRFFWIFRGSQDAGRLASPGRPTTMVLSMRQSDKNELRLEVVVPPPVGDNPEREAREFKVSVEGPGGRLCVDLPAAPHAGDPLDVLNHPRVKQFASTAHLHLDANEMAQTSASDDVKPRMDSDGSLLATALAWMKGAAEEELALITRDLERIVPGVKRIRTLRELVPRRRIQKIDVEGQPVWRPVEEQVVSDRFEIEFDNGEAVPSDLLSEGTVLALGLLTKLHEPERPRLVLLDDLDRGLHIEAQARLVGVLRDLLELDPELQIVCTTHSPYLLDRFEPSEVRMLALDASRHTQVLPLTDHPQFSQWKYGSRVAG
ncbi:MAG: AAA family ATPase [Polyangiaceae bacterium]|nr:AAA family ATPase [Polyangiaceae bacterium]